MVMARYSHCRLVLGRTPSRYGPAMQTPASNRHHVVADLNVSSDPWEFEDVPAFVQALEL